MDVIIRTDASTIIGSGHVMRCLTIAKKLRREGFNVQFWMEPLDGNLIDYVANEGFHNITGPIKADLYIVDHYGMDVESERNLYQYTKSLMVIDDLAREHFCDLLLDQNVIPNYDTRYNGKVPDHCVKLLGPNYLIMRDEFIEERKNLRQRSGKVKRLLVFMGGSDPTNETMKVLQALSNYKFEHIDVVVGNSNPVKGYVQAVCEKFGYQFHCQINYMAQLMQQADFAIGAGGATTWERCYLGLPSSATIVAKNQLETTEYANSLNMVINLGWHENVSVETYSQLLSKISKLEDNSNITLMEDIESETLWLAEIKKVMFSIGED